MSLKQRVIFVKGLRLEAAIGVYAHEHGRTQPLIIDAKITLGLHPITQLKDTLNYELIGEKARDILKEGHITLVETFCEQLAQSIVQLDQVLRVELTITKPEALRDCDGAGCSIIYESKEPTS